MNSNQPTAADVADYQQAIRRLRETVARLLGEMHEVADALRWNEIEPQDAAKKLQSAINGEVQSEQ